ncbi:hypothetical protein CJP72_05285 [Citrobacter sp. NCU1]|uniref:DUF2971 domain-containing protein n=1 Tax=Citrobacter sp. NCU1 TaxID=2026683 RepID=UPI0013909BD3|nr:DUF2971 domain-containing protein [Citrobacter sp. NCU1]NDO80210.1 hypothetical protein [Citrobacter sp. NCU1]
MLYYRYRSANLLSTKELIYDELYFSYPSELNDPLDGFISYEFPEDFPKWKRLLDFAWKDLPIDTTRIAEIFAKSSPLSVKELATSPKTIYEKILEGIDPTHKNIAFVLAESLKNYISAYIPSEGCSVSFSKTYQNALMWSHYTGKHEGYCLIFRSIDGSINQCPSRSKESIKTSEHSFLGISKNFKLHDVLYGTRNSVDGFTLFPHGVYGRQMSAEEHKSYWENMENMYLTKSSCWDYEQEARLYIAASSACVSQDLLSPIDRIFHYDNSQIAGVIFGMRMSESNKKIIREILLKKSIERYMDSRSDRFLFDIVSFESQFDDKQHAILINPSEIFNCGKSIKKSDPEFASKFTSWSHGEALHIQKSENGKGNSCSRVVLD